MTKRFVRNSFSSLAVFLIVIWPAAGTWNAHIDVDSDYTLRVMSILPSIRSGSGDMWGYLRVDGPGTPEDINHTRSSFDKGSLFRLYITPEDSVIKKFAARISSPGDAYDTAVRWIYIFDEELYQVVDKWLTPNEFLTLTPYCSNNPLKGKNVGDCEEKANTLVSLLRASGIRQEEVRVVLGEVMFNHEKTGHAWVELLHNGRWLALDPSWGPYWDNKAEKLVDREGVPFDYYSDHDYPVLQVWLYYNDAYFLTPGTGSGNAPTCWYF